MSTDAAPLPAPPAPPRARRPWWGVPIVVVAVVVIAVGTVYGVRGLFENPVRSTDGDVATLAGSFEPYCPGCARGYIQAGGRSVYVQFPAGCRAPARAVDLVVRARRAPDLGSNSYRALDCP